MLAGNRVGACLTTTTIRSSAPRLISHLHWAVTGAAKGTLMEVGPFISRNDAAELGSKSKHSVKGLF